MNAHTRNLMRAARFIRQLDSAADGLTIEGVPALDVAWSLEAAGMNGAMVEKLESLLPGYEDGGEFSPKVEDLKPRFRVVP